MNRKQFSRIVRFFVVLLLLLQPIFFLVPQAHAVATTGFLRLDRMATTIANTGTVCMTPNAVGSETKLVVTFPGTGTAGSTSFGVSSTAGNWTVTTTNLPTGAIAFPGITTATAVSGAAVTFPITALTTATQYCFNFTGGTTLTNPTSAGTNFTGTIQTQTAGSTPVSTVNFATSIISNDQVAVTGTVSSTFTMTLGSNTAALGTLTTTGAPNTATVLMTVSTNANNGWLAWIKNNASNTNSTLTSATTSDTSISSGAYTTGAGNVHSLSSTPGYGMSAAATAGAPTISTEYAGSSTTFGSFDSTKFEQFASKSSAVSGSQVTLTVAAEASATTKAATDYTDTLTITAAGQF